MSVTWVTSDARAEGKARQSAGVMSPSQSWPRLMMRRSPEGKMLNFCKLGSLLKNRSYSRRPAVRTWNGLPSALFVAQGLNRIETGRAYGWNHAADQSHHRPGWGRNQYADWGNDESNVARLSVL